METKKSIDIGKYGDKWTDSHKVTLLRCTQELFHDHIPYTYSEWEIAKLIVENYATDRPESKIARHIRDLLIYDLGSYYIKAKDIIVVKEYTPLSQLNQEIRSSISDNELLSYDKSHSCSRIQTKECRTTSKIIYVRPTILDADYAEIFTDIFLCRCSNINSNSRIKDDLTKLRNICNNSTIDIPLGNRITRTAAFFLIDFLLAEIVGQIERGQPRINTPTKTTQIAEEVQDILNQLTVKIKYVNSQEQRILEILRTANSSNISEPQVKNILLLKQILKDSSSTIAKIPEYSIDMPRVFELYVYSQFQRCNKGGQFLEYKPTWTGNGDQNRRMEPDVTLTGPMFVIDSKYKFQYRDVKACELDDAGQMVKYLLKQDQESLIDNIMELAKSDIKALGDKDMIKQNVKNPHGVFVYPNLLSEGPSISDVVSGEVNSLLSKIAVSFPLNKAYLEKYDDLINPL